MSVIEEIYGIMVPPCITCRHLHRGASDNPRTCAAFEDGIPDEIIIGLEQHEESVEGDGGIVYEPNADGEKIQKKIDRYDERARVSTTYRHNQPGDHPEGHEFADWQAGTEFMYGAFPKYYDQPDSYVQGVVDSYTNNSYDLNETLRSGKTPSGEQADVTDELDFQCSQNPLPREVVLYRGTNLNSFNLESMDQLQHGMTIVDKGFGSTTWNKKIALDRVAGKNEVFGVEEKYTSMNLKIIAPKGTKGVPVDIVQGYVAESEWILPRNTKYRVLRLETGTRPGQGISAEYHQLVVEVVLD